MDLIYLWNNRIIKEKDVDRYIDRNIVHSTRTKAIKYVLIGIVSAGMLAALIMLGANKQQTAESKKVTTAVYNGASQNTK